MTQKEFETIVAELRPMMYDVGMRYFHSQDDAEDVAQESLLRLWKFCANMDAAMNVKGLAVKVAKKLLYKHEAQERPQPFPGC